MNILATIQYILLLSSISFSFTFLQAQEETQYFVSKSYKIPELELLISYTQQNSTFDKTASEINNYLEKIDKTNLELLIKTQFYRIFLNHSQKLKAQFPGNLQNSQKLLINKKLKKTSPTQSTFTRWLIENLLQDFNELGSKTRPYITPWLKSYLATTNDEWRNEIQTVASIYFKKIIFHLKILNKNTIHLNNSKGQDDQASTALFYSKIIEMKIPKSKSQSIDEVTKQINKKLPKTL